MTSLVTDFLESKAAFLKSFNARIGDFNSVDEYLLARGQSYRAGIIPDEIELWLKSHSSEDEQQQCYKNSQNLALSAEMDGVPLQYVEGLAQGEAILPLPHAWIAVGDVVVDFTWGPREAGRHQVIIGDPPAGWEYFGVALSTAQVRSFMLSHSKYGSLIDDWECHWPVLSGAGHREDLS